MIEMPVRHQNGVGLAVAGRKVAQAIIDSRHVWLNARTQCNGQKIYAREIGIDEQCASFEFELVTFVPR